MDQYLLRGVDGVEVDQRVGLEDVVLLRDVVREFLNEIGLVLPNFIVGPVLSGTLAGWSRYGFEGG